MSWFFGSSKKKDPPQVTVDPNPIDGFIMVQNAHLPATSQSLYPNLNNGGYPSVPSSLPYNVNPNIPTSNPSTGSSGIITTRSLGSGVNEVQNQLESVPFRLAPDLNLSSTSSSANNNATLNEFIIRHNKLKHCIRSGEFDYDFKLERNVLREAKMVNGHTVY